MGYDYLEHHGILGMKWGIRRYQNEDGTYTEAGKRRRNVGVSGYSGVTGNGKRDVMDYSDQELKDMQEYSRRKAIETNYEKSLGGGKKSKAQVALEVTNIANKSVKDMKQLNMEYAKQEARMRQQSDLSQYSDDELRKIVNRMNLEQQYRNLSPVSIDEGSKQLDKIFDVAGGVLGITASAIGIAVSIKQLTK